ncbi:MAG: hypothetical protein ACRCXC_07050 [Legionella sp.]
MTYPKKKVYVCTKLAIVSTKAERYEAPGYYSVACDWLNTDGAKQFFLTKGLAETLLKKKGAFWCMYEINIDSGKIKMNSRTGELDVDDDYEFKPTDIMDMHFHSTFMPGELSKRM